MNKIFFFASFLFLCFSVKTYSQSSSANTFKISGFDKITDPENPFLFKSVEYDLIEKSHLIIISTTKDKIPVSKLTYLFTGEVFKLKQMEEYIDQKTMVLDGKTQLFSEKGTLEGELVYKNGVIIQGTNYYSNGQKYMFLEGSDKEINGTYKVWFENGQLNFEGQYVNNVKNGVFHSYDQEGKKLSEGTYEMGKLVAGEPVVLDIIYENPEVQASFQDGFDSFQTVISKRVASMSEFNMIDSTFTLNLDIELTIEKSGKVLSAEPIQPVRPFIKRIINSVFNSFPVFIPAKEEGIVVTSTLIVPIAISKKGIEVLKFGNVNKLDFQIDAKDIVSIDNVETLPEFPGGLYEMRKYLAQTIRYPIYAQEHGIQGEVMVSFVINKDGMIGNLKIVKSAHPVLDEEAIRVVKSMPRWKPGTQRGNPVNTNYTVPINFRLG